MTLPALFLDFDGVLHGVDDLHIEYTSHGIEICGDKLFRYLPLLTALLDRYPANIVISSSWRQHYSLDELRGFFGSHRDRVIGVTRSIDVPHELPANRFQECRAYAEANGIKHWLMIDDHPGIVWGSWRPTPAQQRQVVFCDPILGLSMTGALKSIVDFLERAES